MPSSARGWSFKAEALRCMQRWAYDHLDYLRAAAVQGSNTALLRSLDGIVSAGPSPAQAKGIAVHAALAARNLGRSVQSELAGIEPAARAFADVAARVADRWPLTDIERGEVVMVEEQVHVRLPNERRQPWVLLTRQGTLHRTTEDFVHTVRFDLVVRDRRGKHWVIDYKTTSGPIDRRKKEGFILSGSILGLILVGQQRFGAQFGGVRLVLIPLVDGRKPQTLKPKAAPWAVRSFARTIAEAEARIAALVDAAQHGHLRSIHEVPKTLSEQGPCMDRYGRCPYFERCMWGAD